MHYIDMIEKKKNNKALTKIEIQSFITDYVNGKIPDYQASALLMAIYFQGLNTKETTYLTEAMLYSGEIVDLSSIKGITCDKHSTGGVGDKTSLSLAPMVAACGGIVAKMSGRGLGHTGGTLDKVESITNFKVAINSEAFIRQVNKIHLAIISQSETLVPADKKLYALRDVSATVNSIPLIASSIMSKKLACGSDAILLDVKYGEGAFMHTKKTAKKLARTMIDIGKHFHKDVKAMISDMNQPLGLAIGNALEVKEAIATLKGEGPQDFYDLCLQAGSIMLMQSHIASDEKSARNMLIESIKNNKAFNKLIEMVQAQGGDVNQIFDPQNLPQAKYCFKIKSEQEGFIHETHALKLGNLAMHLGAGRLTKDDQIDHSVGIVLTKKTGDFISRGEVLAHVYANKELHDDWEKAFHKAYSIKESPKGKPCSYFEILT